MCPFRLTAPGICIAAILPAFPLAQLSFPPFLPLQPPPLPHVLPPISFDSVRAQAALPDVQGVGGVYFAGAWAGYGFHEDGLRAGVDVARRLGAVIPWGAGISTSPKMGPLAMLWLAVFDRCGVAWCGVAAGGGGSRARRRTGQSCKENKQQLVASSVPPPGAAQL